MSIELAAAILNRGIFNDGRGHLKPILIKMAAANSMFFKMAAANSMVFRIASANFEKFRSWPIFVL